MGADAPMFTQRQKCFAIFTFFHYAVVVMASPIKFRIEKKLGRTLGRAGVLQTPHGNILTPSFVVVGTKATVKALSPEQVATLGAQVVLANTYHLYLQPGSDIVQGGGGLHEFMNWRGPTMTDSGGFQVFSLGAAWGSGIGKILSDKAHEGEKYTVQDETEEAAARLAKIDEEGVEFRSHIDGSKHRFTPESSMAIQHDLGADMIFAFDECTSPTASRAYQEEALDRTHRWAQRSLDAHKANKDASERQALLGIVQGGRFRELREKSARFIGAMDFDGYGIGGSFEKKDMDTAVGWVSALLPEEKPRHLLGIGEPMDLFGGVENGIDLFDCVAPTRMARNGTLHTGIGRINIFNAKFVRDFAPIEEGCPCYTCKNYTRSYLAHLFRAKEMYAGTLASIHNLYFIVDLVHRIRASIIDGTFFEFKEQFMANYYRSQ